MRFTNATTSPAGWTTGYERDGREVLIVFVKATYGLPLNGEPTRLATEQAVITEADEFTGEPGVSATCYETDYAQRKPGCDVLLLGSAHAPKGAEVRQLTVGLQVGPMNKTFNVLGDRTWQVRVNGTSASAPEPFARMPITYDCAFGGVDRAREQQRGRVHTFLANPVGRGFWHETEDADGKPLPNTEEVGKPVLDPRGSYVPMAFSPIGRSWIPRARYAGTYDQQWLDHRAPLWPDDFDHRYFQAAAADQVIGHPQGGEQVVMRNLTADGLRGFRLPETRMPVTFAPYRGRDAVVPAVIDTIVLEPDRDRFTMTWRACLALPKSIFDVKEVIAGEMSAAWHRSRRFPGKTYFTSLAEAVAAHRRGRRA